MSKILFSLTENIFIYDFRRSVDDVECSSRANFFSRSSGKSAIKYLFAHIFD